LEGVLDLGNQSRFKEELNKHIITPSSMVILDLGPVSFIDSACLGALIAVAKKQSQAKGKIVLASLSDEVRSVFQITRLDKIFQIFDTLPQALKSFDNA
jgi:anti-sigma B factor antagonist